MNRLEEIRARLKGATTDLDWVLDTDGEKLYVVTDKKQVEVCRIEADVTEGNAELITHAPADLEYLLAHVEKLTKALQKIGLNVDRINVREKTNIEEYCREVARDALAEVGGMRHLCHQKNFTIMNG